MFGTSENKLLLNQSNTNRYISRSVLVSVGAGAWGPMAEKAMLCSRRFTVKFRGVGGHQTASLANLLF